MNAHIAPSSKLLFEQFADTMLTFGRFEARPTLAIAVSGGADSTALMLLASKWAKLHSGRVIALTVNHGLRSEAITEAEQVKKLAVQLGAEHHTLTIDIPNKGAALQEQARTHRYQAMEEFCKTRGILHLLTAHHADDATETFAMRAWRGNSVSSLVGIPAIRYAKQIRILRPLLHVSKQKLIAFLEDSDAPWIEDPSNQTDSFERNRLRKQLANWPVDHSTIEQFTKRMTSAASLLDSELAALALESIQFSSFGSIALDTSMWEHFRPEVRTKLLQHVLLSLGQSAAPPRHAKLHHLYETINNNGDDSCLSGLHFQKTTPNKWHVFREVSRAENPATINPAAIQSNPHIWWDHRFFLSFNPLPANNSPYQLAPLGTAGLAQLKTLGWMPPKSIPRSVFLTVPAIWHLDQLAYVPHIHIESLASFARLVQLRNRWQNPLLGSPHGYL